MNEGQSQELEALLAYYQDPGDVELNVLNEASDGSSLEIEAKVIVATNLPGNQVITGGKVIAAMKLPPVVLRVCMPPDYLDEGVEHLVAPHFTISASWLTGSQLNMVCEKLDELWSDCEGAPIVLMWLEYLRSDMWRCLSLENDLGLVQFDAEGDQSCDPRVLPTSGPLQDLKQVLESNADPLCNICQATKPRNACMSPGKCSHAVCLDCLKLTIELYEKADAEPQCPVRGCSSKIAGDAVSTASKDKLSFSQLIEKASGTILEEAFTSCPRCLSFSNKKTLVVAPPCVSEPCTCSACGWVFCIMCRSPYHASEPCQISVAHLIRQTESEFKLSTDMLVTLMSKALEFSSKQIWEEYEQLSNSDLECYVLLSEKITTEIGLPEQYLSLPDSGDTQPIRRAMLHFLGFEKSPLAERLPPKGHGCSGAPESLTWHFPFFVHVQAIESAVWKWTADNSRGLAGLMTLRACQRLGLQHDPRYFDAAVKLAPSVSIPPDILLHHDLCGKEVETHVQSKLQANAALDMMLDLKALDAHEFRFRPWYREQLERAAKLLGLPEKCRLGNKWTTVADVEVAAQEHLACKVGLAEATSVLYFNDVPLGIVKAAVQCLGLIAYQENDVLDKMCKKIVSGIQHRQQLAVQKLTLKRLQDRFSELCWIATRLGLYEMVATYQDRPLSVRKFEDQLVAEVMDRLEGEVLDFPDLLRLFRAVSDLRLQSNEKYRLKVIELGKLKVKEFTKRFHVPATWTFKEVQLALASHDRLSKMDINDLPGAHEAFQRLFDLSFKQVYTQDRRGRPMPNRLVVDCVEQVRNLHVWADYVMRRSELLVSAEALQQWLGYPEPITVTWWHGEGSDDEGAFMSKLERLQAGANEHFLFHGTSKENAARIVGSNFRLSLAGSNAGTLYGRGIYLAENVSKSDEYSLDGTILVCRASLGSVLYNDEHYPNASELEMSCLPGPQGRLNNFQSVLGDREKIRGTFREFIVFDERLVYPEFVVHYHHAFDYFDLS